MAEVRKAWGQLVSITDVDSDPVIIDKAQFVVGRAPGCDLSFTSNKLISGKHLIIERDATGRTWIEDSSTNGTLLNLSEKLHRKRRLLTHGDEIHLVYRKGHTESNLAFVFQDLEALKLEESDATQDYVSETDIPSSEPDPPFSAYTAKSEVPDDVASSGREESPIKKPIISGSGTKRKGTACPVEQPSAKKPCLPETAPKSEPDTDSHHEASAKNASEGDTSKQPSAKGDGPDEVADSKEAAKKSEESSGQIPQQPTVHSDVQSEIEESLVCIICQEIFYLCISLQPCMHSFCAPCYSGWMVQSDECPSCRDKVERIRKNHIVNNLVEAYLKVHPEKARPPEEISELDSKNKITTDMLYPKKELRRASSDSFSSAEEEEHEEEEVEDDDSEEEESTQPRFHPGVAPTINTIVDASIYRPARTVCRQCPDYMGHLPTGRDVSATANSTTTTTITTTTTAAEDPQPGPSTAASDPVPGPSGVNIVAGSAAAASPASGSTGSVGDKEDPLKAMPTPVAYTCTRDQTHVLCQCCLQPMPYRSMDRWKSPDPIPPIQCILCYRNFCHAYWGCFKDECRGCIAPFKDLNFRDECLRYIILDNIYESGILENYLKLKNISMKEFVKVCMLRFEGGAYYTRDQRGSPLTQNTYICFACGLRNLKDLAYQYRRDIPRDQLPEGVTCRPDCHWGRNCRTQRNKPHHAVRFNHICEQTKTS